jgi:hypothetical protein
MGEALMRDGYQPSRSPRVPGDPLPRDPLPTIRLMVGSFFGGIIAVLVITFAVADVTIDTGERDSTDSDVGVRSGMSLYTDYATCLQYVGNPRGGITPRMGRDGTQILATGCK